MRALKKCAARLLIGAVGIYMFSPACAQSQQSRSQPEKIALPITYKNTGYGFCFSLPARWKGYSIVREKWHGWVNGPKGDVTVAQGPIVTIRHPSWVREVPRQDIPIMVFTRAQWRSLQQQKFFVSAAPFGPEEIGRNSRYVFALPPRYNYAFPPGYEEVGQIMWSGPLRAPCSSKQ